MSWRQRADLMRQIAEEQPALILMDSGKPDSLFNMTGGASVLQTERCAHGVRDP